MLCFCPLQCPAICPPGPPGAPGMPGFKVSAVPVEGRGGGSWCSFSLEEQTHLAFILAFETFCTGPHRPQRRQRRGGQDRRKGGFRINNRINIVSVWQLCLFWHHLLFVGWLWPTWATWYSWDCGSAGELKISSLSINLAYRICFVGFFEMENDLESSNNHLTLCFQGPRGLRGLQGPMGAVGDRVSDFWNAVKLSTL